MSDYVPDQLRPLTDRDLARLEADANEGIDRLPPDDETPTERDVYEFLTHMDMLHLIAEIRRLRSDEWLVRAADEIDGGMDALNETGPSRNEILDILRKHRDGR